MGVLDGQAVNASNTNAAFIDANQDDVTVGRLDLNNSLSESGERINNIQREHNSIASFVGKAVNAVKNALPSWATSNRGTSGDNLQERIEAIDAAFDSSSGHAHDGTAGNGAPIDSESIENVPLVSVTGSITILEALGSSADVSTSMSAKTPSNSSSTKGVVVNFPYNYCLVREGGGTENDRGQVTDNLGNVVFARITESDDTWTVSFYVNISGVETAYSFAEETVVSVYYQELFSPIVDSNPYNYSLLLFPAHVPISVANENYTLTWLGSESYQDVDVSAKFTDAAKAIWQVRDSTGVNMSGIETQIISSTTVRVLATELPAGTYTLFGLGVLV